MTKIYITGGPGSGKTTYAKKLAKKMNLPCFDLDDIKWINRTENINKSRPKEERKFLLNKILQENDHWICEGVYFQDWIIPIIEHADKVIILQTPRYLRQFRITKRSVRRMLGFAQKKHKENFVSFYNLLSWSHDYEKKYLPILMEKLKSYKKPFEFIK